MPDHAPGGGYKFGALRLTVAALALVIALAAWMIVLAGTEVDQEQAERQSQARASNLALLFEEQVYRQQLSIDQTLRILKMDWERNPVVLDTASMERRTGALSDFVSSVEIVNGRGRVVGSTNRAALDRDVSGQRFFVAHRTNDYFGPLTTGPFQENGAWFLNISRRLNGPLDAFGGVVVARYDLDALSRDMAQAELGPRGVMMLVGRDGIVRAASARSVFDLGADISHTALFEEISRKPAMGWTGLSGADQVLRIHAWHLIPNSDMTLVVGLDRAAAMAAANLRRTEALVGAAIVTGLVLLLALVMGGMISAASMREAQLAHDRAVLEAANAELAAARERADEKALQLSTTLSGMSDGICMFDAYRRLVQWNTKFAELMGLSRYQLRVNMPLEEIVRLQAQAGEYGAVDEAGVQRLLERMTSDSWPPVYVHRRPNGMVIEMRRTRLGGGGAVSLFTDITARKQAEDAQARAREQAELAAQEKSRFVAIVSHEIRTPLNVALNALTLLDEAGLSDAQRQLVGSGRMAGQALMGLLNDILDLSRLQSGQLQLSPAPCQLRPLLQGVVELFRPQAAARGVELSLAISPQVPELLITDAGRLRQVLMNLVNNAAKFASPGTAQLRVGFATLGGEPVVRFAVRDSGPDIPDLDRARLFRPFSQLERHGTGGTGLGLAICQLLANLLGGQVGCDPVRGGGKEFWLTLPREVVDAPAPRAVPGGIVPLPVLPRTRVLLVEDIAANQLVVATLLRRDGHRVDCASSGAEALELAAAHPYDVVLMDIFMPGLDGIETTRQLRELGGVAAQVPVIALTANVSEADRSEFLAAGMVDAVAKPVERGALLAALARHVWAGGRKQPAALARDDAAGAGLGGAGVAGGEADEWNDAAVDRARVARLRSGLPAEVCEELFAESLQELRGLVPRLETALRMQDAAEIRQASHAMLGVAGNYGFTAVEAAVRAVRARPPGEVDSGTFAARLLAELDRTERAIRSLPEAQAA